MVPVCTGSHPLYMDVPGQHFAAQGVAAAQPEVLYRLLPAIISSCRTGQVQHVSTDFGEGCEGLPPFCNISLKSEDGMNELAAEGLLNSHCGRLALDVLTRLAFHESSCSETGEIA